MSQQPKSPKPSASAERSRPVPPPEAFSETVVVSHRPLKSSAPSVRPSQDQGQPANPFIETVVKQTAAPVAPDPVSPVAAPDDRPTPPAAIRWIRAISPLIWATVLLIVILPLAGRWVIGQSIVPGIQSAPQEISVALAPQRNRLDQAVVEALQTAQQQTRQQAKLELDEWIGELEPRVDSFLDWYFDYFTQKRLEITAPIVWAKSATTQALGWGKAVPEEVVNAKLTEVFQREFTKRVLVPQTAQLRLEVITTAAADRFVTELGQELRGVQGKYRIPQGQWERYLDTIATTVNDTEGNLSNLSLKALVGGGGYLAAKPFLVTSIGKLGSKLSTKFTASAATKLAAKTGSSVAAELGTSLIDPIVGVGILIWDVWDYQHTVTVDRPLLRSNIESYLHSMERSMLDNPETGIMAAIQQLEASIVKHISAPKLL